MADELTPFLDYLREHGVRFEVAAGLFRGEDHDGPLIADESEYRPIELPGLPPFVEHRRPDEGIAADHATFLLAETLLRGGHIAQGSRFWDIGCGTGVLATAAGLAGARVIVATDVDAKAIEMAKRTASEAGVNVQFYKGSVLHPLPRDARADVVVANLPHKPVPPEHRLLVGQNGGSEGDAVHGAFVAQACDRFAAGTQVFFFLHSLPNPELLLTYQECFDLTVFSWKRRFFQPGEYGPLQEHFVKRTREGSSWVAEAGGRRFALACIWRAVRK